MLQFYKRSVNGLVFSLILAALSILCRGLIGTHVLREKTNLHNLVDKSRVSYVSRAERTALHTVVFAILPLHMDELTSLLHDISDPSSKNYGKHRTKQEVAAFTANPKGYEATMQYLRAKEAEGAVIVRESPYGEYITATAPVHVWEETFATAFHTYEVNTRMSDDVISKEKKQEQQQEIKKKHVQSIIRAEEYSLPAELADHVTAVFNTVQFPPQNILRKSLRPIGEVVEVQKVDKVTQSSGIISGTVTPALINLYYNVTNNTISSTATQAVYESLNQSYSPSDLTLFQKYFNLEEHPVAEDIGGHAFNAACVYGGGGDCIEANLDVQYIMGIAENIETIYDYSDVDTIDWMLSWITTVATSPNPAQVTLRFVRHYIHTHVHV